MYRYLIFTLLLSNIAFANEKPKDTIPFLYEKTVLKAVPTDVAYTSSDVVEYKLATPTQTKDKVLVSQKTTEKADVQAKEVASLVSSIRTAICSELKDGSFKVWLKFDAEAKILGIGTSSEGGIEVNVTCKAKTG